MKEKEGERVRQVGQVLAYLTAMDVNLCFSYLTAMDVNLCFSASMSANLHKLWRRSEEVGHASSNVTNVSRAPI